MKRVISILLACLLCICLFGCGDKEVTSFDRETEGILNVVIFDEKTEALSYEVIGPNGSHQLTEEFELDPLTVLNADHDCFQSNIVDGKVINTVTSVTVFDEETGEQVVPDAAVVEIFNQTAAMHDHDIFALDIITCKGLYFPVVELNVNLQAPVILYYFNAETNTMTKLCAFDSVVIGGLQIPDPERLP